MKELHLICNAHLDPVWQWNWDEGAAAALATFYSAAELADEYDYIFCHNEALLYEYIEASDSKLFNRIKELVKKGKWVIMGGWYVQPDCNLPSGEAFVRQIETGLSYFKEKFGVRPSVALNFDSFGHTQGLVQILKKCGYDGYIFCRPMKDMLSLPSMAFKWKGLDGSEIKAVRVEDDSIYCSNLGQAVHDIKRKMQPWEKEDVAIALWGVGNHGGGASRKDLKDIEKFIEEEKGNVNIFHSSPEKFFAAINPDKVLDKSLQPVFVKCYSSCSRLKQRYVELENKLFTTEKLCSIASANSDYEYNEKAFNEAQKSMAAIQFHDVLSGTSIEIGEKSSIAKADYALEILQKEHLKAFLSLSGRYEKAEEGVYPVFVFNPNPYEIDGVFETEILLLDAFASETERYDFVIKKDGVPQEYQIIKEDSCINFDRRKRFAVKGKLNAFGLTRFDIFVSKCKKEVKQEISYPLCNSDKTLFFNKQTGCLNGLKYKDKDYLGGDAFMPISFDDNADPWGWWMTKVGKNYTELKPTLVGRVVEDGKILTEIENEYTTGKSTVRISYKVYNNLPYVDIAVNVCWNDMGKGLKLAIPTKPINRFIGQTAFGTQVFEKESESCAQRFCAVIGDDKKALVAYNNGTFGCSYENDKLLITIFNGSVYCAHPVGDRPIIDENRFNKYIETGRHEYKFRLNVCDEESLEREAAEFVNGFYALNVYPHGNGNIEDNCKVDISDKNIVIVSLRKHNGGYMIRLMNNSDGEKACEFSLFGQSINLCFGKYEVKTLLFNKDGLKETPSLIAID